MFHVKQVGRVKHCETFEAHSQNKKRVSYETRL